MHRSGQKEGRRYPRCRAEVPCSRGGAHGGKAVPLQSMGTTWSRFPHAAIQEPSGQQMRPEGGVAHGEPTQEHSGPELQPMKSSLQWSSAVVHEGLAPWYRAMLRQCLKSTVEKNVEKHEGSVWKGLHSVGVTPCWSRRVRS